MAPACLSPVLSGDMRNTVTEAEPLSRGRRGVKSMQEGNDPSFAALCSRRRFANILATVHPCTRWEKSMKAVEGVVLNRESLPVEIPAGYTGPLTFPGNGKRVWWTGRVAIGLRHEQAGRHMSAQSALWIQDLLLEQRVAH